MTAIIIISILILLFLIYWVYYVEIYNITGCDARGDGHLGTYLKRYILYKGKNRIYFHKFMRSDYDDMHDHPWDFITIPLWRGYIEEIPIYNKNIRTSRFVAPFTFNYRPAEYIHRVVLRKRNGKELPAYSIIFTFYKHKPWGFFTKNGFMGWREYITELKCWD